MYKQLAIEVARRIVNYLCQHPPTPSPKLVMTLLVKDEADVLEHNILFHKAMGVDYFIITDNGSTDRTAEIIRKYCDLGWIVKVFHEIGTYNQVKYVDQMIRYIIDEQLGEWILNCDADEFWIPQGGSLKSELVATPANVISCPLFNVIPIDENKFYANTSIVVQPSLDAQFSIYAKNIDKVIHRAKGYQKIHQGNHNVSIERKNRVRAKGIYVHHYNIRNFEQFVRKFRNLATPFQVAPVARDTALHVKNFISAQSDGQDMRVVYAKYLDINHLSEARDTGRLRESTAVRDFFALQGF